MITLYGGRMGSSLRPHWALCDLGLSYEAKSVDVRGGEQKSSWFLALNPAGQIPVIDVDGFVLAESMAIVQYLAAKYHPKLLGATLEDQARGMQWALWIMLNVQGALSRILMPKWTGVADEAGVEAGKAQLAKHLPILEMYLGTTRYLAGSSFTTSDINGMVALTYARMAEIDLSGYPNVAAWMSQCEAREAYQKAVKG